MRTDSVWSNSNDLTRQRFERATELTVSGAGSQLLQTFINRTVQQLTLREFGLQAVLSRKVGSGDAEYVNSRAAGTTGGEWVADSDPATSEVGTYTQASFGFKTLLTRGKVTRKLQAQGRSYGDILAEVMSSKAEDFANALEEGMLNGNVKGAPAAAIPNGFLTQIQSVGSFDMSQCVSITGASTSVANLSLDKLDEAIDLVKGSAQRSDLVIVGSFAGIRQVNNILQAQQRFDNVTEIAAGFRVRTYDGIPLIISTAMGNAFQFDGTTAGLITDNTGGTGTMLMILNTRYADLTELTPVTVMPLAKASSQYDEFDMYWDGAPVLRNTKGGALLTNLSSVKL